MAANYKESSVSGTKWRRCRAVTCLNPLVQDAANPRVVWFQEEDVMAVGDDVLRLGDVGAVQAVYAADGSFPILNPLTGEPTGATMSHDELYAVLYSLYIQAATARDLEDAPAE